jgi:hypothetical protein
MMMMMMVMMMMAICVCGGGGRGGKVLEVGMYLKNVDYRPVLLVYTLSPKNSIPSITSEKMWISTP